MPKSPKRPRDPAQLAKMMVDIATGQQIEEAEPRLSSVSELAGMGGLKGGKARAATLTPQRRRAIAQQAAQKRWNSKKEK
jgi:hypothetical protein